MDGGDHDTLNESEAKFIYKHDESIEIGTSHMHANLFLSMTEGLPFPYAIGNKFHVPQVLLQVVPGPPIHWYVSTHLSQAASPDGQTHRNPSITGPILYLP